MPITQEEYTKSLAFWNVALQFFTLVQNSVEETIKQGNEWTIVTTNKELTSEEYNDMTRWSDHQIIIPLLFNFYHGVEILVKGFLNLVPGFELKPKHSLEHLCSVFIKNFPKETELCNFLKEYIHAGKLPTLLSDFIKENGLTIDQLYEALRYPTDPSFTTIRSYLDLKYKGEEGLEFFKKLCDDIEIVRKAAVKLGRTYQEQIEG
jgi:DNA-binding phage protein